MISYSTGLNSLSTMQIVGPLLYTSEEAPEYRRGLIARYYSPYIDLQVAMLT